MRRAYDFLQSTTLTLMFAATCWGQGTEEAPPEGKGYVASYFIVGLGVALGLVAVCRAAKRHKEVRRPE